MPDPSKPLKSEVVIYTDGGSEPNPGQGGWGAILLSENRGKRHEKEISGNALKTTNNRMEMTAMLEGLKDLTRPCDVTVYTDSKYLQGGIGNWKKGKPLNGWCINWRLRDWRRKNGPLLNVDLWQDLWEACENQKSVSIKWIKGHSEDHYNDRCDALATKARLDYIPRSHK